MYQVTHGTALQAAECLWSTDDKFVLSVKSVVEIRTTCTPVPGGHYQIVTGGNALGIYDTPLYLCLDGSTPQDGFFFFYHG